MPKNDELINISTVRENLTTTGKLSSYSLSVIHNGLNEHREFKSKDISVLQQKAEVQIAKWQEKWARVLEKNAKERNAEEALSATEEAQENLKKCESLLRHTLEIDDRVNWSNLMTHKPFSTAALCTNGINYANNGKPDSIVLRPAPEPVRERSSKYQPNYRWFDYLWWPLLEKRRNEAQQVLEHDQRLYQQELESTKKINASRQAIFDKETKEFELAAKAYQDECDKADDRVRELELRWREGEPDAIAEHAELVLNASEYPDWFKQDFELGYKQDDQILIVDYELPSPDHIPTLEQVTYIKSRDEMKEKHLSDAKKRSVFDSICYQVALRTVHELFEADEQNHFNGIVFNGFVTAVDKATGIEGRTCILSLQTWKEEFLAINLALVDPKECFRKLKGVAASTLAHIVAVPPKIRLDFNDARFIEGREVSANLDDSVNLAAMDWEDFEHLIREVFSQRFSAKGGEVHVTQGSRDGGVDAIALDPDPIMGGKIVIQAKRYTNTVGVSAVRDLYGTLLNEGANRGILVTTSNFGPDAYKFAVDKPISLIDGSGLLSLLEEQGHNAIINLTEAKKMLSRK